MAEIASEDENSVIDRTVPLGWDRSLLGNEVEFTKRSDIRDGATEKIPFIPMELLPSGPLHTTSFELRATETVKSGVPFREGDILLAKITPCLENGKQGIARGIPGGWGFATTEVFPFRPKRIRTEFLAFFLKDQTVRLALATKMQGATGRQRLPREALERLAIPVPPDEEQQAIVKLLSAVQEAGEATDRVSAAARALKRSLMRHLFAYGPVRTDDAGKVEVQESPIGALPRQWRVVPCAEVCDSINVGVVVKPASYYVSQGAPAFRSFNVREDRLVANDLVFFSHADNTGKLKKSRLRTGDVLIVRTGYPGTSCVVPPEYDGANCIDLVFARPKSNTVRSRFLSRFFNSEAGRSQSLRSKTGLAQQHLNVGAVKQVLVPVPPLETQDQIVGVLDAVDRKIAAAEDRRAAIENVLRSLLSNLMSGAVRVPEAAMV